MSARGLLESQIEYHQRKAESLKKELLSRETSGQQRIHKICKEYQDAISHLMSSIEFHEKQASSIQNKLDSANVPCQS